MNLPNKCWKFSAGCRSDDRATERTVCLKERRAFVRSHCRESRAIFRSHLGGAFGATGIVWHVLPRSLFYGDVHNLIGLGYPAVQYSGSGPRLSASATLFPARD